jgi:hypothetical protein
MSSVVPGSAFGRAAEQSGGAGVPLVMLFERDDAVAVPLLTQLRMAGYDVRAARTPVELFDTLRKHAVALILVDLGSAAVSRREFWVALDSQRRGRAIQIVTFRTGVGPRMSEPDLELSARALADVDLRGARDYARIVENVRQRVPLNGAGVAESAFIPPLGAAAGNPGIPGYGASGYGASSFGAPAHGTPAYGPPGYGPPGVTSGYGLPGYGVPGQPSMVLNAGAQGDMHGGIAGLPGLGGLPTASPFPAGGAYPPHGAPASNGTGIAPSSPFAQPAAANPFAGPASPPPFGGPAFGPSSMFGQSATPSPGTPGPASSPFAQPYSSNPFGSNPPGSQPSATNPGGASPFASTPAGGGAFGGTAFGGNPLGGNLFGAAFPSANPFGSTPNGSNPFGTNLGNIFGSTPSSASHPSAPGAPSSRPGTGAPFDPAAAQTMFRTAYGFGGAPAGGAALGMRDALGAREALGGRDASAMATAAPASEMDPVQDAWMPPGGEELIGTAPLPDRFNERAESPRAAFAANPYQANPYQANTYQESWPGESLPNRRTEVPLPMTAAALDGFLNDRGTALNAGSLNGASLNGASPNGHARAAARDETLPISIPEEALGPTGPLDGQNERALGTVLVEGALLTPRKLEALQGIRRMLGTIGVKAKLGELALHFHLLSPDQLLAALLVSRRLVTPQQIAGLGRVKQEMAASGMDYDLEALLLMFGILPAEELSQLRAELA